MQVALRGSIEVPNSQRFSVIAYAGHLGVWHPNMGFRQAAKACLGAKGERFVEEMDKWLNEMVQVNPAPEQKVRKRAKRKHKTTEPTQESS